MEYFDLHCDTIYECLARGENLLNGNTAVNMAGAEGFCRYLQCFALWIPDGQTVPFALYERLLIAARTEFSRCGLPLLAGPADRSGAHRRAALLSVEGGGLLEGEAARVDRLYADGVRTLTLTWNGENALACGAQCPEGGLKPFGRAVLSRMNALGMACDLSHLNRPSFAQALPLCRYPLATHSCFDAVCPHVRNLTDRQAIALAERGGIIGLCFYPQFLGEGAPADRLYEQIMHGFSLGLEGALAIGSDFDGARMHSGLDRLAKVPKLYDALRRRGVKPALLRKIFYENAANFYAKVLTNA